MKLVKGTMIKLFSCFKELGGIHHEFNEKIKIGKSSSLESIYNSMGDSLTSWNESFDTIAEEIEIKVVQNLKYNILESESFQEVGVKV